MVKFNSLSCSVVSDLFVGMMLVNLAFLDSLIFSSIGKALHFVYTDQSHLYLPYSAFDKALFLWPLCSLNTKPD